jgi:urate oxidase
MNIKLVQDSYGKYAVRVGKITRYDDHHDFKEIHVNIQLEGDFTTVYTEGDNTSVLPTDTMKNTIYALAQDHPLSTIEDFALFLTNYFLENNPQVEKVRIDITQIRWERMSLKGVAEPHTYIGGSNEKWTTHVQQDRQKTAIQSGIKEMRILKTTHSEFVDYVVDKFTTLPPTSDRIMATELECIWYYNHAQHADFQLLRNKARENLLTSFAAHHSLSVQHTLYAMGEAVLKNVMEATEINMKMPNLHYIPFNMKPLGLENRNEIFVASGDAFGYITGTLKRE